MKRLIVVAVLSAVMGSIGAIVAAYRKFDRWLP